MRGASLTGDGMDNVVEEIVNHFADVLPVVEVWTDRCLGIVRATTERSLYGVFLCSLNRHPKGALRQDLRNIAMNAFRNAVCQKLYEDLSIFKYWAAMILSDVAREVLDEEMLNEALRYLLDNDPAAVRVYLHDVAKQLPLMSSSPWSPSDETTNFVRYRPLSVVRRFHAEAERGEELPTVNFSEVRQASLEINIFCALLTGDPAKELLFDAVRSSPLHLPLVVPDVLSAILHADLCASSGTHLDDNLDLLNLVIDGPERETREMLFVAEAHEILKDVSGGAASFYPDVSCAVARLTGRLISDETRRRARK